MFMKFLFGESDDFFASPTASRKPAEPKRILVVDDDDSITHEAKRVLERDGFRVQRARNGQEAKTLIGRRQFDLILSDIKMPVVGGIELCRFVRETDRVPFVLMSGFADLRGKAECGGLCFDGILPKPFGGKELLRMVKTVIEREI